MHERLNLVGSAGVNSADIYHQGFAMPSSTSRNPDPHSNPEQSADTSQHAIQPQNTTSILGLFEWFLLTIPRVLFAAIIMTLGGRQTTIDGHEQPATVATDNDIPRLPGTPHHGSLNPPATVPMATQFQGAHGVNISGNTRFTNIGMNTGNLTTVYNYGGTHGLEKLEKFVSFAALHDSAEQDPDRRCHPGTRKTVLRRLRDWFDNPDPTDPIIWLHGPAGAGKSAIAQTIAHEYKERGLASTFFFCRSDAERNDGNRLFPTIVWQLAFSISAIKDFIVHVLDKTPHLPRKDVETQFERLVAHPFQALNSIASQIPKSALVVIIDGVDQ
ncbi:hypothetical protein JOM56_004855 [Amanita muscaria]